MTPHLRINLRLNLLFFFLLILLLSLGGTLQAGTVDTEAEVLVQKGRYVTVTVMPGNPVKIFVAGKERAQIDMDDLTLEASYGQEKLRLSKSGDYYVVDKPAQPMIGPQVMEVRTTSKKKKNSENFKFNINKL